MSINPKLIITACAAALVMGCGGGGPSTQNASPLTGVFLDSAVSGINYRTQTQSGTTNAAGEYKYITGEQVTFSVGSIVLPSVAAASVITPLDIAGTLRIDDSKVVNLLVFLQSLDADGDPSNGISIPASAITNATTNLDFALSKSAFRTNPLLTTLIAAIPNGVLKSEAATIAHFAQTVGDQKIQVAPVSNAGADQSVPTGAVVTLDGSYSADANADSLTHNWTLTTKPQGSTAVLSDASAVKPTFTADIAGTYTVSLVVNDGKLNSNSDDVSIEAAASNEYFTKYESFLNAIYPTNAGGQINSTAIDINGDGKLDLVFHYMGGLPRSYSGTGPTPNAIRIYIQQPSGELVDQTFDYLIGTDSLIGASRKIKTIDINGDGKMDILFAINHEDGRDLTQNNSGNAQQAALISVGNSYKIIYYGRMNFYHSVGAGFDSNGNPYVLGEGFYGDGSDTTFTNSYYIDTNGSVQLSTNTLPKVSPQSFELLNPNGYKLPSKYLIQAGFGYLTNNGSIEGYQLANGVWQTLAPITPTPSVGFVDLVDASGNPYGWLGGSSSEVVYKSDNSYVVYAAYTESCKARINPQGEILTLFLFAGRKLEGYTPGQLTSREDQLSDYFKLRAFNINNGALLEVPLNISNEVTGPGPSGFFDCLDVNGDGYDDIVVYSKEKSRLSIIYLNDRNGGFKYIGQQYWSNFISDLNDFDMGTSVVTDFNGDGISDLLIVKGGSMGPSGAVYFLSLKGIKKLN